MTTMITETEYLRAELTEIKCELALSAVTDDEKPIVTIRRMSQQLSEANTRLRLNVETNERLRAEVERLREWGGRCQSEMEHQAKLAMDASVGRVAVRKLAETEEAMQTAFERWITASPFEMDVRRWPNDETKHSWPGQYKSLAVNLAWLAWREATAGRCELRNTTHPAA